MEQREVIDPQGTSWTCVQAYAGLDGKNGEKATKISQTQDCQVPVVCTPRGGAQSVRLELPADWFSKLSDEALVERIGQEQAEQQTEAAEQ